MIKCTAPTRIDLAGSTLDIWPLYLKFDNPPTLNAAINLYASVEIRPSPGKKIRVHSKDFQLNASFPSIDAFPDKHPLDLILKLIRFYRPKRGFEMVTDCQAPPGSGIGGSSALAMALNGALQRLTGSNYRKAQWIEIGKNIETQVISVPTGWQDYFPAVYGGVLSVEPGGVQVGYEAISANLQTWSDRFVLSYTGKPRQSGINNWEVFKSALDGDHAVLRKLYRIAGIARDLKQDLVRGRIESIAQAFNQEWKLRKALAPGICTSEIDQLVAVAKKQGALAARVCGAGGGGCVSFFVRKGMKENVSRVLEQQGAQVLKFRFVRQGLRVRYLE